MVGSGTLLDTEVTEEVVSNCQRQPRHRAYECIARRSPDHPKTDQVGTQIQSKIKQNGREIGPKTDQVGTEIHSKINKMEGKLVQNRSQEAS